MDVLGGGMSGGAALTFGGGGRKGGGGMLGGSGPGGKKVGILAALASASDCSEITCEGTDAVMRTTHGDKLSANSTYSVCLVTWMLLPSRLCRRRPSTLLMVAVCPPITSIVPLDFLKADGRF